MVNRLDAADLAALAFVKGFDGITPGMWLQLQKLMNGDAGAREMVDPEQLSKLVKNLLDSCTKEGVKDGVKFTHLASLLPTLNKAKPEGKEIIEVRGGEKAVLEPKPKVQLQPETEARTLLSEAPKEKSKEATILPQRPVSSRPFEEMGMKSPIPKPNSLPMQHAIKDVLQAMVQFLPHVEKKGAEPKSEARPDTLIPPSKEASNSEFMAKREGSVNQELAPEKATPTKADFTPTLNPMKGRAPLEHREIERQVQPQIKQEKIASTPLIPVPIPLTKKELGSELTLTSKAAVQSQVAAQTHSAERTVIPGAPYTHQQQSLDSRRKEKKKYPHYFSDREEDEQDPEKEHQSKR